ncbi:uncharacterized protein LOC126298264 [Schistocerca gregaria]|uniref:uncharacterized protein LOC126298264 n=1 Tax=Schistocerca gregaria TaxID=7010 RepID=UPI00211E72B6|nr:uncharacterized protein LOC126298264 [Schistocerca gregaria]
MKTRSSSRGRGESCSLKRTNESRRSASDISQSAQHGHLHSEFTKMIRVFTLVVTSSIVPAPPPLYIFLTELATNVISMSVKDKIRKIINFLQKKLLLNFMQISYYTPRKKNYIIIKYSDNKFLPPSAVLKISLYIK